MARTRGATVALGAVAGVVVFLFGYLITWILAGAQAGRLFVSGPLGGAVADWKAVTWVFFDSHFVGTRTPRLIGPGGDSVDGGFVDTVGLLGVEYLYVVPILLLLVAGAAVAWRGGASDPYRGMLTGMTVAAGYVLAVVLGMMVSQQTGVGPNPLRAIVIAGVVYPVALGAIGGAASGLVGRESERDEVHGGPTAR
jgi:hypothetical protein